MLALSSWNNLLILPVTTRVGCFCPFCQCLLLHPHNRTSSCRFFVPPLSWHFLPCSLTWRERMPSPFFPLFLKLSIFFWKRHKDRSGFTPPNACNSLDWVQYKKHRTPQSGFPTWVSGSQVPEAPSLPSRLHTSRKLEPETEPWVYLGTLIWDFAIPTGISNPVPNAFLSHFSIKKSLLHCVN